MAPIKVMFYPLFCYCRRVITGSVWGIGIRIIIFDFYSSKDKMWQRYSTFGAFYLKPTRGFFKLYSLTDFWTRAITQLRTILYTSYSSYSGRDTTFIFVFSWRIWVVASYWCRCATSPPPAGSLSSFSRPETFPRWTSPASQVRHGTSQGSFNRPLKYDKKFLMGVITGLSGTTRNFSWEL